MNDICQTIDWWLIRHAPVVTDQIYGQMDVSADFSDTRRIAEISRGIPEGAVFYSSDLQRCLQTCQKILSCYESPRSPVEQFTELREQSFGSWEGKTYAQVEELDKKAYEQFWLTPATSIPKGGESFDAMAKRVSLLMDKWVGRGTNGTIVVSTHAGPVRAMLGYALDLSPARMLTLSIAPLSISRLTSFRRGSVVSWQIHCINDVGGSTNLG
jgi:alpha-ribazole phosphatase